MDQYDHDQLLPGYRFYPTEEELIEFYLYTKLHCQKPELDRVIPSVDIYNFEPFQLPELAGQLCQGDPEQWFFFMPQQEREARGGRPNRSTATGYWKATGTRSYVYSSQKKLIGEKKTMVFYKGRAPTGTKTKWKMNEYKAIKQVDNNVFNDASNDSSSSSSILKDNLVQLRDEMSLCRVYITSGCARAFDRRPLTTTTININTTQNIHNTISTYDFNSMQVGERSGSTYSRATINGAILSHDSSDLGRHDQCTTLQCATTIEGSIHNDGCDIEMIESLDNLIDWEQAINLN